MKNKKYIRKTGDHKFVPCGGVPKCADCGADEDDAYVGGEQCTYKAAKKSKKKKLPLLPQMIAKGILSRNSPNFKP